jgi:hypothetical protein
MGKRSPLEALKMKLAMNFKPWLREALVKGSLSFHQAILVEESSDPDWERLIKTEGLDGHAATKVMQLRELRRITLDDALRLFSGYLRLSLQPQSDRQPANRKAR